MRVVESIPKTQERGIQQYRKAKLEVKGECYARYLSGLVVSVQSRV